MEVFALIGPSGSGKSHRAGIIAHKHNIPLILDDGLLIWDGMILGGRSSKREETRLAAIRRALFYDQEQVKEVKEKIVFSGAEKILILGTSLRMVERIIKSLGLPDINHLISIEQIASSEEIKTALTIRNREGKHVIPVPTIEVRPKFPGYFINRLELLLNKGEKAVKKEKSIIRPKFSYYGSLIIYDQVIADILNYRLKKEKLSKIKGIKVVKQDGGLNLFLVLSLEYGIIIPDYVRHLQSEIKEFLQYFTGIEVLSISVEVSSLFLQEGNQDKLLSGGIEGEHSYYSRSG